MLDLSIVTPTYNRKKVISRSIDSSIKLVKKGFAKNIIIVDDASTDGTFNYISNKYENLINSKVLMIYRLDENSGVGKARNIGVKMSQSKWIAFMDSDDYFLPEVGPSIEKELEKKNNYGIFFFRCLNINTGSIIGKKVDAKAITFRQVLNDGIPGECLPIIKKKIISKFPFHEALRGCEGITYLKILKHGIQAFLSNKIVRGYNDSGEDRLSSKQSIINRSREMLHCNILHLRYIIYANPKKIVGMIARIVYYSYLFIFNKIRVKY